MIFLLVGNEYKAHYGTEIMTREQMIEELVEYEFTQVTMVEVVQMYIKLQREFMDQTFSDDEIADRYNDIFGEEEVVH